MIEPFIIRAIIAGVGIAIIAGAIGCFVVWRKMAYFGDSLAHSALLGVALGLVMGISTNLGTIIICSIFAVVLIWLQQKKYWQLIHFLAFLLIQLFLLEWLP